MQTEDEGFSTMEQMYRMAEITANQFKTYVHEERSGFLTSVIRPFLAQHKIAKVPGIKIENIDQRLDASLAIPRTLDAMIKISVERQPRNIIYFIGFEALPELNFEKDELREFARRGVGDIIVVREGDTITAVHSQDTQSIDDVTRMMGLIIDDILQRTPISRRLAPRRPTRNYSPDLDGADGKIVSLDSFRPAQGIRPAPL